MTPEEVVNKFSDKELYRWLCHRITGDMIEIVRAMTRLAGLDNNDAYAADYTAAIVTGGIHAYVSFLGNVASNGHIEVAEWSSIQCEKVLTVMLSNVAQYQDALSRVDSGSLDSQEKS